MTNTCIWCTACSWKACVKSFALLWSQMDSLHMCPGAIWEVLIYKQKYQLPGWALILNVMPLTGTARTTEYQTTWQEIQPTPRRAALTGHMEGDNPLSSPSFVHCFTFVQSRHICRLDNKGAYSLWKKHIPGHKQWRLCLCACTQTKIQLCPQLLQLA